MGVCWLGLLLTTASLNETNSCCAVRKTSLFSLSLLIRYSTNTLLSGTDFKAPLVIARLLGDLYVSIIEAGALLKISLDLNIPPLKHASAINKVCLDLIPFI